MKVTLRITDVDTFYAIEDALNQFVTATSLREDALYAKRDAEALATLRRLNAARRILEKITGVLP